MFETNFWKVIHNKYLFNYIFNFIKTTEWVEIKDYKHIHIDNRKRFEDINSVDFMVKSKLYELLKCKIIKSDEILNDWINGLNRLHYESDKGIVLDIVKLILHYRKDEIQLVDFIARLITSGNGNENIGILQAIISKPHSYKINDSIFEKVITKSTKEIIKLFIDNVNPMDISESIKGKTIHWAVLNPHRDELESNLNSIIDNQQLYTAPTNTISNKQNEGMEVVLSIQYEKAQNKLLDIQYHKINLNYEKEILDSMDEIIMKFKDDGYKRIKELIKFMIIKKLPYTSYKDYIGRYKEPIMELSANEFIRVCLVNAYSDGLKYFKENVPVENQSKFKGYIQDTSYLLSTVPRKQALEFIQIYSSSPNFNIQSCNDTIVQYILSTSSNEQEYYETLFSICNDNIELRKALPSIWNPIIKQIYPNPSEMKKQKYIYVIDKETIDWVSLNIDSGLFSLKLQEFKSGKEVFRFENFQLIQYAKIQFGKFLSLSPSGTDILYSYPFSKAIENCDIQQLEYLESIIGIGFYFCYNQLDEKEYLKNLCNKSSQEIILLSNYLNKNGFKRFDPNLYNLFLNQVSSVSLSQGVKLKFDFDANLSDSIKAYINSIIEYKPNVLQLMMVDNNWIPLINHFDMFDYKWIQLVNYETDKYIYSKSYEHYEVSDIPDEKMAILFQSNSNYQDIAECIRILLHQSDNYYYQDNNEIQQRFEGIINYLFNRLISVKHVPINIVRDTHNLISKYLITIDQTLFHSIFYLSIRSQKLVGYITQLPFILSVIEYEEYYDFGQEYFSEGYNIVKYLNPLIFSFDYVIGDGTTNSKVESFEVILDKLMDATTLYPLEIDQEILQQHADYVPSSLDHNLFYLLIIRRTDLFFKYLDKIPIFLNIPNLTNEDLNYKISLHVLEAAKKVMDKELYQNFINNDNTFISFNL